MKLKSESEVAQSCLTLNDPIDGSPPGSSIHGVLQARVLEWVAIAFFCLEYCKYNQFHYFKSQIRSLDEEDPLEKETATHSSTLAWRTPWTEEPGGLQSRGLQRAGHD